ncbi:MAG: helix-turn-helix domain-containing protein [Dehalococcoidia bacterium]
MAEKGLKSPRILALKHEGWRDSEIARKVNCSRQYVHFVLHGGLKKRGVKKSVNKSVNRELLTTSEAAEMLKVAANTIRSWSESGLIASHRVGPRGDRRFRRSDVMQYLNSCKADVANR